MKILFIDSKWKEEIVLDKKTLEHLKKQKIKSIALFADVQFLKLDKVKQQLKETEIEVLTTKAKRAEKEIQILGCNIYEDNFSESIIKEADAIVYIGDGLFHPKALLLAQIGNKIKPIIIFDPASNSMRVISEKEIQALIRKFKANIKIYMNARKVGILVTIKPGQQYLNLALRLKEKLEKEEKKAFIFISDSIDLKQLENFPFIQAWVNSACPRIGTDDSLNTSKPLINIREAFESVKWLEKMS